MCYGLLKIYLKEVLGSFEEINDLVSSYFIKTVLLWEIQTNSQHNVGEDSLLQLFRNCLQKLYMLSVLCHYHLGDFDRTEIEFQLLRKSWSDMRI